MLRREWWPLQKEFSSPHCHVFGDSCFLVLLVRLVRSTSLFCPHFCLSQQPRMPVFRLFFFLSFLVERDINMWIKQTDEDENPPPSPPPPTPLLHSSATFQDLYFLMFLSECTLSNQLQILTRDGRQMEGPEKSRIIQTTPNSAYTVFFLYIECICGEATGRIVQVIGG